MIKRFRRFVIRKVSPTTLYSLRPVILTIIFLSIIGDIVFVADTIDIITLFLIAFNGAAIVMFKTTSKMTFLFSLSLLLFMYIIYLFFGPNIQAEKAATWLFLFLGIGFLQQWKELKSH